MLLNNLKYLIVAVFLMALSNQLEVILLLVPKFLTTNIIGWLRFGGEWGKLNFLKLIILFRNS